MAKRSDTSPATHGTGLEPPRSDSPGDAPDNNLQPDPTGVSAATATQKRGRGRPPKPKSDSPQNGAVSAQPTRKSGRPKRNGATAAAVPTASAAAVVKSGRGRPKRSNTLPVTESLVATVDGSRKRGRPKRADVAAASVPATTVAAPAKKRGRKPKSEEVASKRTVGRPKKATKATTGQEAADPRELKKKAALLQKKVKQAADKLKIAVSAIEEVQVIADGM